MRGAPRPSEYVCDLPHCSFLGVVLREIVCVSSKTLTSSTEALFKQPWMPLEFVIRGAGGPGVADGVAGGAGGDESGVVLPKQLISAVQVLSFTQEEFEAWEEAGCVFTCKRRLFNRKREFVP